MRTALRILLVVVVALQAWHAILLTRYERAFESGELNWNNWAAEEAIGDFERARTIDPSGADVWRRVGDLALYIQEYPNQVELEHDAAEMLERAWEGYSGAVVLLPIDSWSWAGLAEVALNRAELNEARRGLDLAELERRRQGVMDRDRAVAIAAARLAVWLKPAGFQELDVLAAIYESMGAMDEARKYYVESARMMPLSSYHVWGRGRRLPQPLYESVVEAMEEGIERAPLFERSGLNVELVQFARAHGDYETAILHAEAADRYAGRPYETYRAAWELSKTLERLGRYDEALEAVKKARRNLEDPGALSRKQGALELQVGKHADACVNLREALRREPEDDTLRLQAARACEVAGESELAEQVLRDGISIPSADLTLARALVDFQRRHGRNRLADYLLETWARDYPEQPEFPAWLRETQSEGR
jgi:tetratricopeptide (TPR) repeat protein